MCQTVLEVDGLSFEYPGGQRALDNVRLVLKSGESVGLIGPNGAGKSTLLLHLAGLLPEPTPVAQSAVRVASLPVVRSNLAAVRSAVGILFQDPDDQLFCTSVLADVAFGPRNQGQHPTEAKKTALEALSQVGIEHLAYRTPTQLSFGEKKLACLAGVLACGPKVLALDEPTSNLDPRGRRRFLELLNRLPAAKLIATHDLEMVVQRCQRVVLLDEGRVVASGPTVEVLSDAALVEVHGLEVPHSLRGRG